MPTKPPTHKPTGAPTKRDYRKLYDRVTRRTNPALAEAAKLRSSGRWAKFRDWFRKRHPLCADPLRLHDGRTTPAQHVHHIQGLAKRPDLLTTESNCAALCVLCHSRIEGMERRGIGTQHLFLRGDKG